MNRLQKKYDLKAIRILNNKKTFKIEEPKIKLIDIKNYVDGKTENVEVEFQDDIDVMYGKKTNENLIIEYMKTFHLDITPNCMEMSVEEVMIEFINGIDVDEHEVNVYLDMRRMSLFTKHSRNGICYEFYSNGSENLFMKAPLREGVEGYYSFKLEEPIMLLDHINDFNEVYFNNK